MSVAEQKENRGAGVFIDEIVLGDIKDEEEDDSAEALEQIRKHIEAAIRDGYKIRVVIYRV